MSHNPSSSSRGVVDESLPAPNEHTDRTRDGYRESLARVPERFVVRDRDDLVHCTATGCRFGRTAESEEFDAHAEGDVCPDCGERLARREGIEAGHIFRLGIRYAAAPNLTVDREVTVTMGSYGIGVTRVVQTLVQQARETDEGAGSGGLRWPVTDWGSVAPYRAAIVPLDYEGAHGGVAEDLHEACGRGDVLLFDDPARSIGERFAESDLLGIPAKVVVGNRYDETGRVEIERADGTTELVDPAEVPRKVERFAAGDG